MTNRGPRWLTTEDRFWAKVDKRGPDECWPWLAGMKKGYGWFLAAPWQGRVRGRYTTAHRYSLELYVGRELPREIEACHTCDNPPCVNPAHLFEGTHAENVADRNAKGRTARGARASGARLTEVQVQEIRALRGTGSTQQIASLFGVSKSTIGAIWRGKSWIDPVRAAA